MEKLEMEVEWKLETENESRNCKRKWKCATRWGAIMHMRKVGIAQDTAYRVEMILCAAMEESTESNPINQEDSRAIGLAEGCASNPIMLDDEDSFASLRLLSDEYVFFMNLYVAWFEFNCKFWIALGDYLLMWQICSLVWFTCKRIWVRG